MNAKLAKRMIPVVIIAIAVFWGVLFLIFRGPVVQVPNAHVGKVKRVEGFEELARDPSLFRLPNNWWGLNPSKLVVAETSHRRVVEDIPNLYMPADKLNLHYEVVGIFAISKDRERIDGLFARITPAPVEGSSYVERIGFDQVYQVYGQQVLRTTSQEVMAGYSIIHILENLDSVSAEIEKKVNERLAETPLTVTYCGLGKVDPPQLIVEAQEQARKREIEIATANNQKLVALTKADAEYQVTLKRQQIELLEAETQVLSDLVVSDVVKEAYIAQRMLRVLEAFAENENVTFLLTTRMFQDPSLLLGITAQAAAGLKEPNPEREKALADALKRIEAAKEAARLQAAEVEKK